MSQGVKSKVHKSSDLTQFLYVYGYDGRDIVLTRIVSKHLYTCQNDCIILTHKNDCLNKKYYELIYFDIFSNKNFLLDKEHIHLVVAYL